MARSLDAGAFASVYFDYPSDDAARVEERKLVGALEENEKYEDAAFPAAGSSLYFDACGPPKYAIPPDLVEWNRLSVPGEVAGCTAPVTLSEAPGGGGLVQGALRDRWFLSALGLLASKPDRLKQILVSTELKDRGIYTCKFFKAGKWRYVHVDDRIPCGRDGTPHFARSHDPNETWVMIVEKAFAKLHKCYEALCGGTLDEGLKDATGCPTAVFDLASPELKPKVDDASLYAEIKDLLARGSVVGCCDGTPPRKPLDALDAAAIAPTGLVKAHVYTILEVKACEADATAEHDALETSMVKLTAPWRLGAWAGDWSAASNLWTQYPPIAEACGMAKPEEFAAADPQAFWVEWSDFAASFDTLVVTQEYADDGARMSYRGTWTPGDEKAGAGGPPSAGPAWGGNPQYVFDVTEATRFCAQVSQSDPRWHAADPLAAAPLASLGFTVQKVPGGRRAAKYKVQNVVGGTASFSPRRTCVAPCLLQPGSYALVPSTQKPVPVAAAFVVEMHADLPLTFQNADDEMPDLEPEEEENPELDAESAEAAAAASAGGPGAPPLPEPEGSELQALWTQTAFLASLMKDLAKENKELEAKMKALEDSEP